jgi:hypothetical protein
MRKVETVLASLIWLAAATLLPMIALEPVAGIARLAL